MLTPADRLIERLPELPAGSALLEAARGLGGVHLVGGAVRDLLLGRTPRELDVVVEGDSAPLLERLGSAREYGRFGTATVETPDGRIDVARARRERYAAPAALPDVEPATLHDDLRRRDFSVNAIALELQTGELRAVEGALADLEQGRLRVLHERSFTDDPTRLVRLSRYAQRLRFAVEPQTARLAGAADLDALSGARLLTELRLVMTEPDPAAVAALLPFAADAQRLRAALALLPADGAPIALLLATAPWTRARAGRLPLAAAERAAFDACLQAETLAESIPAAERPSQLRELLRRRPIEAIALAGAFGATAGARRWLKELRHVRLAIGGADLVSAGLEPGPQIGARLERTLARRLDGELEAGRDAELRDALAD